MRRALLKSSACPILDRRLLNTTKDCRYCCSRASTSADIQIFHYFSGTSRSLKDVWSCSTRAQTTPPLQCMISPPANRSQEREQGYSQRPKGLDASWSSSGTRATSVGRSQAPACMLHERTLIKRCNDRIEFMGISRRTEQSGNQLDRAVFPFDDVDVANRVVCFVSARGPPRYGRRQPSAEPHKCRWRVSHHGG
jgi:hypothetical protein